MTQWLEEQAIFINRDEYLIKWIQSKDVRAAKQNHFPKVRLLLSASIMHTNHTVKSEILAPTPTRSAFIA